MLAVPIVSVRKDDQGDYVLAIEGDRLVRKPVDVEVQWTALQVDFNDPADMAAKLRSADAVVHCAIANDFHMLMNEPEQAFDSYVGLTSRVTKAASELGAQLVYISTDWILDGTRHPLSAPPGRQRSLPARRRRRSVRLRRSAGSHRRSFPRTP